MVDIEGRGSDDSTKKMIRWARQKQLLFSVCCTPTPNSSTCTHGCRGPEMAYTLGGSHTNLKLYIFLL